MRFARPLLGLVDLPLALVFTGALGAPDAQAQATAQNLDFQSAFRPSAVLHAPGSIALADLNGDGRLDAVTADSLGNSLSVSLGNGDGTLRWLAYYYPGGNPRGVVIRDLNGDDDLDLVVPSFYENLVSSWLGNGDGTFQARTDFTTGLGPRGAAVADLNDDGRPDIVTANQGGNNVSVLLGNGDGTFAPKTDYAVNTSPSAVAIDDFNADGRPDLAVAGLANAVSVLLGMGSGVFGSATHYASGGRTIAVATGEVNGDGKRDLLVMTGTVAVLTGNGNGSFNPRQLVTLPNPANAMAVGSVNGDSWPDVVVTFSGNNFGGGGSAANNVAVLLGTGTPTFAPASWYPSPNGNCSADIGDLDLDGHADVAVGPSLSGTVAALMNNGDGTFGVVGPLVHWGSTFPRPGPSFGDLDGDDQPDVVVACFGDSRFEWFKGHPDGTFSHKMAITEGWIPYASAIADVSGDGNGDLIEGWGLDTDAMSRVLVRPGNGAGDLGPATSYDLQNSPRQILIGDCNGDGARDLIVGCTTTIAVLLGNGFGSFGAPIYRFLGASGPMASGDLNGDGVLDLVVDLGSASVGLNAYVTLGNGDGTFGFFTNYPTNGATGDVAIGDLSGDGVMDLVLPGPGSSATVLLGNGNGSFGAPTSFGTHPNPTRVRIGDLNDDGLRDLAVLCVPPGISVVSMLRGHGDGTFEGPADFGVQRNGVGLEVSDVNWDGRDDVMVVTNISQGVTTTVMSLLNQTTTVAGVDPVVRAPSRIGLVQVLPNPAMGAQQFELALPASARASLIVFDAQGRRVWTRDLTGLAPGVHRVGWDGRDHAGRAVEPAMYFARLVSGDQVSTRRFVRMAAR